MSYSLSKLLRLSTKAKSLLLLKDTRCFSSRIETGSAFRRSGPRAEKHFDPALCTDGRDNNLVATCLVTMTCCLQLITNRGRDFMS